MSKSRIGAIAIGLRNLITGASSSAASDPVPHPYLDAFLQEASTTDWVGRQATGLPHGKSILELPAEQKAILAVGAATRLRNAGNELSTKRSLSIEDPTWRRAYFLRSLLSAILRSDLPFDESGIAQLIDSIASSADFVWVQSPVAGVLRAVERYAQRHAVSPRLRGGLQRLLAAKALRYESADRRKLRSRIQAILADPTPGRQEPQLEPGDVWADQAIADIRAGSEQAQIAWRNLIGHARAARASRPSGVWLKRARECIQAVGSTEFLNSLGNWFAAVGKPGTARPIPGILGTTSDPTMMTENNTDVLKGLVWSAGAAGQASAACMLGDLAETCFKKIPNVGARCSRVGNACLAALNLLPGQEPVAQLTRLRSRVKQPSVRAAVEKAIDTSAQALGVSRDEVVEMSTPTYGLGAGGTMVRKIGSFSAEFSIIGTSDVGIRWTGPTGKTAKSVPAEIKREHPQELRDLLRVQKDVQKMLPAQVQRLEQLPLEERDRPLNVWRERYLEHPLLSQLSRRLIWRFVGPKEREAIWNDGRLICSDGSTFLPPDDARVRLWHPIDSPAETVLAWRRRLEEIRLTQPFKQAHREVYILTDAERGTQSYSNRFAAHILRQHQFAALCQARGWKYRLMGGFDSQNTPTLELPQHDLRAEFWVESPEHDELSPAGINLRIITDQVRFYRGGEHEPLPLEQIAPRVFSEVMRDVDLFVGVASVGNDPTWQDGGPDGRYQDYWHKFSFGELALTAQTRRAVLQSLLPRLSKIRDRCALAERFLVVRGDIRTYKIHLGSGNILMEPNDQYLCIVPSRSPNAPADVFLPFEGDATLSVILSKAFLLAQDKKIDDPAITRQIGPSK